MTRATPHPIVWIQHAGQQLGLVPSLGGSVAAWRLDDAGGGAPLDLWRPWDGVTPDLYKLASFAMVPWSNRISGGGFEHDGRFHPMRPNRAGEPYPIHGDGWLQPWSLSRSAVDTAVMALTSRRFDGNPHSYDAVQTFRLIEGGLKQRIEVTHRGADPLPYGLGLHPWFPRTESTRMQAPVEGVWLCGADPIPTGHTIDLPDDWNLDGGMAAWGTPIDNGYSGWTGQACIDWLEHGLRLTVAQREPRLDGTAGDRAKKGFCLVYRPTEGPSFCFEPITHPIDAFHMPDRLGLRILSQGESMRLDVVWRFEPLHSSRAAKPGWNFPR